MLPSTMTNFLYPINTCYMFRSYLPSLGIKYTIIKTQNITYLMPEYGQYDQNM